jgi:hypothetical protein
MMEKTKIIKWDQGSIQVVSACYLKDIMNQGAEINLIRERIRREIQLQWPRVFKAIDKRCL